VTDVHIKYFLKTDEKATKALDPPVVCRSDMQDKWHCLHIILSYHTVLRYDED